jgi:mRNA-degrading endonuclease RelE of RelBE toxin-antitoxin system
MSLIQLRENTNSIENVKTPEGSNHDDFQIRIGSLRLIDLIHNENLIIFVLDRDLVGMYIKKKNSDITISE